MKRDYYKPDYKPTYFTEDRLSVDPDDEVWVPKMDRDADGYVPTSMTAREAEKKGFRSYYSVYGACEEACLNLNDFEV